MAGVLYNIGSTLARDSRDESRRGQLHRGIRDALGAAPGLFDQNEQLFPGEQPIPGLQTAGTGLLANPNNQANQLNFASGLFNLPDGQNFGESLIKQSMNFGEDQRRQQAGFTQQTEQQRRQFDFTSEQNTLQRQQRALIEAAKLEAKAVPGQNLLGSIPSGFSRIPLRQGGFADIPNPGTPQYVEAQGQITSLEQSVGAMDELIVAAQSGGDFFGKEAGKQGILYENAVALIGEAFNKGVLQKEEREQIADKLTDPTSVGSFFVSDDRMRAEYQEVQRLLQRKLAVTNQKFSLWGLGSQLATTTPEQIRQLEFEQEAKQKADAIGLTLTPEPIERTRRPRQIRSRNTSGRG